MAGPQRREPALVHAEAHVGDGAGVRGPARPRVRLVVVHALEGPPDVPVDAVVHEHPLDGSRVAEVLQQLVDDELALVVGVPGVYDLVGPGDVACYRLDEPVLALGDDLGPGARQYRQNLLAPGPAPGLGVYARGLLELEEVPGAGDDRVGLALVGQAHPLGGAAHGVGDVPSELWLLGDDEPHRALDPPSGVEGPTRTTSEPSATSWPAGPFPTSCALCPRARPSSE